MRRLSNNKGVVLITALMITLLCLVMVMAILSAVTQGIKASTMQRTYRNTNEAAYGGADVSLYHIMTELEKSGGLRGTLDAAALATISGTLPGLGMQFDRTAACLNDKLTRATVDWANCPANSASVAFADVRGVPDMHFDLNNAGGGTYRVYTKIVDTAQVGSKTMAALPAYGGGVAPELLTGSGATAQADAGSGKSQGKPFVYRIEVLAEKPSNPIEKTRLSVLYEF